MQEVKIKEEFKNLIPPLQAEERRELEQSIKDFGVRDKLITWHGIIVDGHNRYEICQKYDIPFQVTEMEFKDEDEAKEWIMRNQLARRNLTDLMRIRIADRLRESIAARARAKQLSELKQNTVSPIWEKRQAEKGREQICPTMKKAERVETAQEIADLAGVGKSTVYRYQAVENKAPEPIKQAMQNEEISINKAYEYTRDVIKLPAAERAERAQKLIDREQKQIDEDDEEFNRECKVHKVIEDMLSKIIQHYDYITEDNVEIFIRYSITCSIGKLIEKVDIATGYLNKLRDILESKNKIRRIK